MPQIRPESSTLNDLLEKLDRETLALDRVAKDLLLAQARVAAQIQVVNTAQRDLDNLLLQMRRGAPEGTIWHVAALMKGDRE